MNQHNPHVTLQMPTIDEVVQVLLETRMRINIHDQLELKDLKGECKWRFHPAQPTDPYVYTQVVQNTDFSPCTIRVGIANHTPFKDESGPVLITQVEFDFVKGFAPLTAYKIEFREPNSDMTLEQVILRLKARKWLDENVMQPLIMTAEAGHLPPV
jgi:hypothetical protein